jgi:multidrug resistance efflux pump
MLAKTLIAAKKKSAFEKELQIVRRKLDRSRKLVKKGSISVAELEQALREFQNLESEVMIAGNGETVAQLDTEAVKKEIQQINARASNLLVIQKKIAIAKSELEVIDELESASVVKAKTSGMVTEVIRGAGSSVRVGDPIVQIQGSKIWSEAWIKESQIPHASLGSPVQITLKAYPDEDLEGVVSGYLPSSDSADTLPQNTDNPILMDDSKIRLKIELSPSEIALLPGFTGVAVIRKEDSSHRRVKDQLSIVSRESTDKEP